MLKHGAGCPAATNSLRVNRRCLRGELRAAGLSGFQTNSQMSSGWESSSGSTISLSRGDQQACCRISSSGENTMSDQSSASPEPEWAAFLAIDWADKKHAWSLYVPGVPRREHGEIEHSPEAIHIWITQLTTRFAGRPIAVCVEQSRGALLFALSKYGNLVLYPIHPAAANDFRLHHQLAGGIHHRDYRRLCWQLYLVCPN